MESPGSLPQHGHMAFSRMMPIHVEQSLAWHDGQVHADHVIAPSQDGHTTGFLNLDMAAILERDKHECKTEKANEV